MKKLILAALVLGSFAMVNAEGEDVETTRKVEIEAPVQAPVEELNLTRTPEEAPAEVRKVEIATDQAPAEDAA